MKNLIIIIAITFGSISCKAQQEYSINTVPSNIPNGSYIKDINNELDIFVGTYKALYNNKEFVININKVVKKNFILSGLNYYKDALVVKYTIKDLSGNILQSTINNANESKHFITNTIVLSQKNEVRFYYTGGDCGIGWGSIRIKKLNNNEISWSYYPNNTTLDNINCPNPIDTKVYLPETENLIFTKQ
ncbi:DUF6705 family protein [Chryseobacterium bernardetii]|uniref:DUF6705 family protein n=1 Tax=Chryseobacterium bernardetii TaxID=1241978 RepID=UPI003AF4B070